MSLLLHRCPPGGCLSAASMLRMGGWRRWCRLAPWGKGISLFLLLMFFPSFEIPQYFCCRNGNVRTREGSAVQWSSGVSQNTVGTLGTVASSGNDVRERTIAMWDSVTNDVCVDKDRNYRDFFLTGLNLAAVPSTPEGSTPPMQHGIARALQLQRWRLLHQIRLVGFSLVSSLRSAVPTNNLLEIFKGRRLQAAMRYDPSEGGLSDDADLGDIDRLRLRYTPPEENSSDENNSGERPEDPPRPPSWSLSVTEALYYYMPFVAGYITLMGLGIFALLLAIPMLALQLLLPRSQWSSTGVLVNMLCFPAAPFSTEKTPESGNVTRSRGKVLDTMTTRTCSRTQDGVGSEATCKGLSVLSEEEVTQSEAEVKATRGQNDLPQEQHASSEGHGADAPATDNVAQSTRTGSSIHVWTGQNAGLVLLVVLLFSVLMCVSLGFAYTAQIHQALHAFQCALTATFAQVFNGAGSGRQSIENVLSKWFPLTRPPPDDPTDVDYVPTSPEYITALRNLLTTAKMSEGRIDELVDRFSGSAIEFSGSPVGEEPRGPIHSPRRRLAAVADEWMDYDDDQSSAGIAESPTPEDATGPGKRLEGYLNRLFDMLRAGFLFDSDKSMSGGDEPDRTSDDDESEDEDEEKQRRKPRRGRNRRLDFGGIVPLFQVLQRLSDVMNSDSPAGFSNVAATLFAKGLALDYLLLSLYDHSSTLEELIEAIPVSSTRSARFDHVSLARMTTLPFLQVLNVMIPDLRDILRKGYVELRRATQAMTSVEKQVFTGLKQVGGYEKTVHRAGETIQQALNMVSWFRSDLLPPILYVVGAIVTFVLVGSVLYLMHLNRQSVKTWEGGELHPGPSACLGWFLLVVGGAALVFGAALMTLGVITMDGCIFVASTVQNPHVLEQVVPQGRSSPSSPKLNDLISACVGRTNNRDLSALLKIPARDSSAPTRAHQYFSAREIRERLRSQLETARIELDRLEKDELIVDSITTITAVLNLVYELAGIYLIKADVRSDRERTARVAYYSGIQDDTVEFWSIFDLPRAELIGPEGVGRDDLLPLPLTPMQPSELYDFYFARADHPLSAQMLTLLDRHADVREKIGAAALLLGDGTVKGRYRLYGLKDMREEIRPLYFGVFARDNYQEVDPRLMVDDNSPQARAYTQRILGEMPRDQRMRVGEAVELARRKTAVRPGRTFTCIRRVGYTSEEIRHIDKMYIEELTRVFKTMDPSNVDKYIPDWNTATSAFSTVGDATGRRREHVACTYEQHRAQLQAEAVQAVFAVASLHGRATNSKEDIKTHLLGRADAVEDYVGALEDNVDCTPVYRSLLTTQHLVCRDVTERVTLLGITWLFTSLLAIALFVVFFSVWRYLTERYFRRQEAEKARLNALREAEKAAEDARRAHEERVAREEAAAAAAAASAARAEARARQVSAAALNRQRTSVQRAQTTSGSRLQIHSGSVASGGDVRDMLAARDQGNSVEDTMWADTEFD